MRHLFYSMQTREVKGFFFRANITCTLGACDIIYSGAVETLFFILSSLSDIPRPHLKSNRHDKKKQRGKSRQRTSGADGATYVELSSHSSDCL